MNSEHGEGLLDCHFECGGRVCVVDFAQDFLALLASKAQHGECGQSLVEVADIRHRSCSATYCGDSIDFVAEVDDNAFGGFSTYTLYSLKHPDIALSYDIFDFGGGIRR